MMMGADAEWILKEFFELAGIRRRAPAGRGYPRA
jgi:hypothetical protein